MPKVTIYITTHNYGRYIERAVESVLSQTFRDWELIIIDDGSTDNTQEVIAKYRGMPKIHFGEQEKKGLNVSNNIALRLAKGEYIMRLDPDDYLDENILLVLSNILDSKPEAGLAYPDYYLVDEDGEIQQVVRRKKLEDEVELLDLPAHGACTMFRRSVLQEIGGYSEEFTCQDGYDVWLRLFHKYRPQNVNIPLFYYRQHPQSLTRNQSRVLDTRREIKRKVAEQLAGATRSTVLGIVPVIGSPTCAEMAPFIEVDGKPLLWYTLSEIEKTTCLDRVVVSSDDDAVLEYARRFPKVSGMKRPQKYTKTTTMMPTLIRYILSELEAQDGYSPDVVCLLYTNTPLRRFKHIEKAVDTMCIFDVDSVISIQEELAPCYHHLRFGLTPINDAQSNVRLERKAIFKENGAVCLTKVETIQQGKLIGKKVGHITMLPEESIKINTSFDLWLAERIIREWRRAPAAAALA